eukprot:CAMPEP_0197828290 /NCGR_PEP_ID=MMETSP1437-20131217/4888_1 /TAXON_ID=49252 ORGANISM="Eucampia antarctica, Strain CCMP1452" /NCGR_SAMPLE_ID=MMETSP1437 /ASSEMBLY_ACC=CAM_ASM_001096 /LENGTH=878 /DNA_ID=CAMNT_0043429459 /DNA_START=39 /DNA_END=2672 /DNA_ORIENTATION=-
MSIAQDKAKGRVLLPSTIDPKRYDLRLTPDLVNFTFDGEADIALECCGENIKEIVLHSKELCILDATLVDTTPVDGDVVGEKNTKTQQAMEIHENKKLTTVKFVFEENVPASSILRIKYKGFLNNQMAGFYRSSYKDANGNSKIMASTQFESLDARRAFPCWDEPSRKAVFGITIVVPSDLQALSNMPVKSLASNSHQKTEVNFMDTPIMSTYLVAFCVGQFDFVQALSNQTLVKVYTPPGMSESGLFALDCAVKTLKILNSFFGIDYPLPKLDMVAIPEFAMGAMENWGLVTYRQVDLCIDPNKASNSQKQRVCTVVTHELAHQWFGNLVTMAWWDDLWLNEGFASWAENYVSEKLHPEWTMWDQFTTGHLSYAMKLDSLKSSHPIQVPICHAEEVEEVFDGISYCKGGSVVRMIRAVMGPQDFRNGLSTYMKTFAYRNTETHDLWKCWEDASKMPISEMMKSWTEQMGYPLITVTNEHWEAHQVTLTLSQEWFLSDPSAELTDEEKDKKWCVPIFTCTEQGVQPDICFMREKTATLIVPLEGGENGGGWVKLNAGQQVPMRVKLTPTMLERLCIGIKNKTLPICDRAGLIMDAYALAKAGHLEPTALIQLLSAYQNEHAYIVWQGISQVLLALDSITMEDEDMNTRFQSFARILVKSLYQSVGWSNKDDSDGHLTVLLRGIMISLLKNFCYDDEDVKKEASARFEKFQSNPDDVESLPSDMRTQVFQIMLKNGGEKEYEQLLSYFQTTSDVAEQKFVLASLGNAPSPALKARTLDWALKDLKMQDFFYPMGSVGSSREGREISWSFFKTNFEAVRAKIGKGSPSLMDACIVNCAGSFCSEEKADEIEAFFQDKGLVQNARKIAQTLENMRTNAKFW